MIYMFRAYVWRRAVDTLKGDLLWILPGINDKLLCVAFWSAAGPSLFADARLETEHVLALDKKSSDGRSRRESDSSP
jgi:hypothetical protein